MRRVVAVSGLVLVISACVEAFSAHVDVVARAGRAELSVTRLSEIIAPAQSVPLEREYVDPAKAKAIRRLGIAKCAELAAIAVPLVAAFATEPPVTGGAA